MTMKNVGLWSIMLYASLSACTSNSDGGVKNMDSIKTVEHKIDTSSIHLDTAKQVRIGSVDTLHTLSHKHFKKTDTLIADDYPIKEEMYGNMDHPKLQNGRIYAYDQCWFTNDTLGETIAVGLGTDGWHMGVYHFINNDMPIDIVKEMNLDTLLDAESVPASFKSKQKAIPGFMKQAKRIGQKYFITDDGYKLGDGKDLAFFLYGKPDTIILRKDYQIYSWSFIGDEMVRSGYAMRKDTSKPLAYGWGYSVEMYFRKDKLIAINFFNDIP
jgi:hypothetical protein